jgi:hypothetical protein
MPDARMLPTGSVRFWFNAWRDLAQLGGGSEQGITNPMTYRPQVEIVQGDRFEPALLWMQAMAVDAVIMHTKQSKEWYHDWVMDKFAGKLPVLYDRNEGDIIYGVPRRFPQRVRIVERNRINALKPTGDGQSDTEWLRPYVDLIENGPNAAATVRREGSDVMRVTAQVEDGQSVLVQESYDPSWHAYSGSKELTLRPDLVGFLLIDAPPGHHDIQLKFELPLENKVGRALTLLTAIAAAWMLLRVRSVRIPV